MNLLNRIKQITEDKEFYQHLSENKFLYINNDLLEDQEKPRKKGTLKSYTPRSKKMDAISKGNELFFYSFGKVMYDISPFEEIIQPKKIPSTKGSMHVVYGIYLSTLFTGEEIRRMEPEVKKQVMIKLMELTENAYEKSRKEFFQSGYLFEDEYESDRLKHLIDHQAEAIKITTEESTYLKAIFLSFISNSLSRLFNSTDETQEENSRVIANKEIFNEELVYFYIQFAKKFTRVNAKIKSDIFWSYINTFSVNKEKNDEELNGYKELLFCPFSTELKQSLLTAEIQLNEANYDYMSSFSFLENIDFFQVEKVLSTEKMDSILTYLVRLYEAYYIPYTNNEIGPNDLDAELFAVSLWHAFPGLHRLKTYIESKTL